MIIDIVIVIVMVSAFFRGREVGFARQIFSTIGFFTGLLIGAFLQQFTVRLVDGEVARSLITLTTTLGFAFIFLTIGEFIGIILKRRVDLGKHLHKYDVNLGGVLSALSILIAVWLCTAIVFSLPYSGVQAQLSKSTIARELNQRLPDASNIIAGLGQLVDPNNFPQVFIGSDPNPQTSHINLPSDSQLRAAVARDRDSVVKIIGQGCGGLVDGSGFVVGDDLVITNAHVVAGITQQYVTDRNGRHTGTAIWFDPNLDLAILRVSNLAGAPLEINSNIVPNGTASVVLGYPGGGSFTANPASVLNQFVATGRNIYGRGTTERSVYEIAAEVEQGNSGGPLVSADGRVIGVIFARSASYDNIGYALTMDKVESAISKAIARNTPVKTGSCAQH